jgi:hypothetical protein
MRLVGCSVTVRSGRIDFSVGLDPSHRNGQRIARHPESEFAGPGVSSTCLGQCFVDLRHDAPLNGDAILLGSTAQGQNEPPRPRLHD